MHLGSIPNLILKQVDLLTGDESLYIVFKNRILLFFVFCLLFSYKQIIYFLPIVLLYHESPFVKHVFYYIICTILK